MPSRLPLWLVALALTGCPKVESTAATAPTADPRTEPASPRREPRSPARASRRERSADREPGELAGITAAHNAERAKVGVGPLQWSPTLARHAQGWADRLAKRDCALEHRTDDPYGENLYWSSGAANVSSVVGKWADEAKHYDHRRNSCKGVCGHYTQMVWSRSRSLGCGVARCSGGEVWVCNYDPPGNFVGEAPY